MNNKKILLSVFILIALVQIYVPAKMIWNSEEILDNGTYYRFKTAPIDPKDPFRGKYITLNYEETAVKVENEADWTVGEHVYAYLTEDNDGFAMIDSVSKEKPISQNFIKTKVRFVTKDSSNIVNIMYPFNRFYMEESKAYEAELVYRKSQQDTANLTYALVSVKNGEAVLKDVLINGLPIKELVEENRK